MNWSKKDIDKLNLKNNLKLSTKSTNILSQKHLINGKISVEKESIEKILWYYKREGLIDDYVKELEFHDKRKFRFDWAIPSLHLAVEYEGLFSKKSGHTTKSGYTSDCEKYNLAQLNGWVILRYTAINYKDLEKDLKLFLKTRKNNTTT